MDICYDKCTYVRCIIILYSQIKNMCYIFYFLNKNELWRGQLFAIEAQRKGKDLKVKDGLVKAE